MRFLADQMLGSLARWLRFFGFDTAYPDVLSDSDLVALAKKEDRILLTRDRDLAQKKDIKVLYVESTELESQLVQVIQHFNLDIERPFTRCALCNSELIKVEKKLVEGMVPEKVFERQNEFLQCPECDKYYWQGTHFTGIKNRLETLVRKTTA